MSAANAKIVVADSLAELHRLCDWVVTLDRNAGIEYFDSPQDNQEIYDAYIIDCVPEREDLGCLQLITSTANLDEVRNLLDGALDQMGLSHSLCNAEFLQWDCLSGTPRGLGLAPFHLTRCIDGKEQPERAILQTQQSCALSVECSHRGQSKGLPAPPTRECSCSPGQARF